MRKLNRKEIKEIILDFMQGINNEKRYEFMAFGNDGRYTDKQKNYAFELIRESGIRATSKILKIPRRTLQRWCRKYDVYVRHCPDWVYGWAERRRKRRLFWQRRGHFNW
jgi:hypothetical protein